MTFTQRLSELLNPPKEPRPGFPWILFRLVSPSLTTLEILLAAVIVTDMMADSGALRRETAQAIAELAANLDRLKLLPHPAEALAIVLLIHKGGNALMSILEKVLQPLLNAQRELGHAEGRTEGHAEGRTEGRAEGRTEGHAEGRTEGHAELRSWLDRKNRAEAEGKPFNEPPPDKDDRD